MRDSSEYSSCRPSICRITGARCDFPSKWTAAPVFDCGFLRVPLNTDESPIDIYLTCRSNIHFYGTKSVSTFLYETLCTLLLLLYDTHT